LDADDIVPYRDGFALLIPSSSPPDVRLESEQVSLSPSALDDATGAQRICYQIGIGASVFVATGTIRSFEEEQPRTQAATTLYSLVSRR
jgi:hypothetical protein